MKQNLIPASDMSELLSNSIDPIMKMRESSMMVFGGTGFVGKWLVTSLIEANRELNSNIKIKLVSRDIVHARKLFGANANIEFIELSQFSRHPIPFCDFYIHGATPTLNSEKSLNSTSETHLLISKYILNQVKKHKNSPTVMHLNSGAIYGKQDISNDFQKESFHVTDNPINKYTKAKLEIDKLFTHSDSKLEYRYLSPRLYAFAGPQLPLDAHFAIGNFLGDALTGRPITMLGNSMTRRSYMYPTDLVHVIFELLVKSPTKPINVGSDQAISMGELAKLVSSKNGNCKIEFNGEASEPNNYVPSITNLREYVSRKSFLTLEEILERWMSWIQAN